MSQIGLINIIRTSGAEPGSGVLGPVLGLIAVIVLGVGGYRVLDSALRGVAASTAEANRVVGWAVAVVLVVGALTAAGWVLLARRRALREAPVVEAFTAATDRALEARRQRQLGAGAGAHTQRPELPPGPPHPRGAPGPPRLSLGAAVIAAVIITALLTVIAAQTRAVGPAVVLGVVTVALLAVVAPDFVTGVGHVLAAIAGGIGDGISRVAEVRS